MAMCFIELKGMLLERQGEVGAKQSEMTDKLKVLPSLWDACTVYGDTNVCSGSEPKAAGCTHRYANMDSS